MVLQWNIGEIRAKVTSHLIYSAWKMCEKILIKFLVNKRDKLDQAKFSILSQIN